MAEEMTKDRLLEILRMSKAAGTFPTNPIFLCEFDVRHIRANVADNDILAETKVSYRIHGYMGSWEEFTLAFTWASEVGLVTIVSRDAVEAIQRTVGATEITK